MGFGDDGDGRPYYYRLRGRALGPFTLQQMRQKAASAQVNSRSDVSRDGLDWGKGSDYPEVFVPTEQHSVTTPDSASGRSQWYYAMGGTQQGPVELTVLQQYVAAGSIKPTDVVFKEGMTDWVTVQAVPELAMVVRHPGSSVNGPGGANANAGSQGVDPATGSGTNGLAIAGFVCSLLGWLTCIPALLGLIFSLVALNGKNRANRGLAIAGAIIGGIWLLLWIIYILFMVLAAAANASLAA